MSTNLIEIAREVYDTLLCGNPGGPLLEKLYEQILEQEGCPRGVACFTAHSEEVASRSFYFSELIDRLELEEDEEVTDSHILEFARDALISGLDTDSPDDTSVNFEEFEFAPNESLYVFALVRIDGHTPVVNWQGAYTEVSAFYSELKESGYITSEEDVNALPDDYLLELWGKYSTG